MHGLKCRAFENLARILTSVNHQIASGKRSLGSPAMRDFWRFCRFEKRDEFPRGNIGIGKDDSASARAASANTPSMMKPKVVYGVPYFQSMKSANLHQLHAYGTHDSTGKFSGSRFLLLSSKKKEKKPCCPGPKSKTPPTCPGPENPKAPPCPPKPKPSPPKCPPPCPPPCPPKPKPSPPSKCPPKRTPPKSCSTTLVDYQRIRYSAMCLRSMQRRVVQPCSE